MTVTKPDGMGLPERNYQTDLTDSYLDKIKAEKEEQERRRREDEAQQKKPPGENIDAS